MSVECRTCSTPITHQQVAYRVRGLHRPGPRRRPQAARSALICQPCYTRGTRPDGLSTAAADRTHPDGTFVWESIIGGPLLPPHPCAGCGRTIVRGDGGKRMRHITCSPACDKRARRLAAQPSRPCSRRGCEQRIPPAARADAAYCSHACRSAAHRDRSTPTPRPAEDTRQLQAEMDAALADLAEVQQRIARIAADLATH